MPMAMPPGMPSPIQAKEPSLACLIQIQAIGPGCAGIVATPSSSVMSDTMLMRRLPSSLISPNTSRIWASPSDSRSSARVTCISTWVRLPSWNSSGWAAASAGTLNMDGGKPCARTSASHEGASGIGASSKWPARSVVTHTRCPKRSSGPCMSASRLTRASGTGRPSPSSTTPDALRARSSSMVSTDSCPASPPTRQARTPEPYERAHAVTLTSPGAKPTKRNEPSASDVVMASGLTTSPSPRNSSWMRSNMPRPAGDAGCTSTVASAMPRPSGSTTRPTMSCGAPSRIVPRSRTSPGSTVVTTKRCVGSSAAPIERCRSSTAGTSLARNEPSEPVISGSRISVPSRAVPVTCTGCSATGSRGV